MLNICTNITKRTLTTKRKVTFADKALNISLETTVSRSRLVCFEVVGANIRCPSQELAIPLILSRLGDGVHILRDKEIE